MTTTSFDDGTTVRTRIAAAAGCALLVAGLLLVAVVLPAEYAVDPLGTGAKLGLLDLGITGQQVDKLNAEAAKGGAAQGSIVVDQDKPFVNDTEEFVLGPREGIEFKYRLDKGQALLYSWTATGPVNFEFHAEPDGAPKGYAQTYEKKDAQRQAAGTLTAPFPGIHGWYWENTTSAPVTVSLKAAGFFTLAHKFVGGGVENKTFK
jgi:hypothetical protein